jgi:hypothetical protein
MYRVPESTTRRINDEFSRRIRVRWSDRTRTFHVEGRSHRGLTDFPMPPGLDKAQEARVLDMFYDDFLRARDGYQLIMEVQPGRRMKCPRNGCHVTLQVPLNKTAEVPCWYCKSIGYDGRYIATYFDLESDTFIERLRYLDPERAWREKAKTTEQRNAERTAAMEQDALNFIGSVNRDEYARFAGIPQSSTAGKTSNWTDAPESPLIKSL